MFDLVYLNSDPRMCAQEYTDQHVKEKCLEYVRMLSLHARICKMILDKVYSVNLDENVDTIWEWLKNNQNYNYVYNLCKELFVEHEYRFGKKHVSEEVFTSFHRLEPRHAFYGEERFTRPNLGMPVKYWSNRQGKMLANIANRNLSVVHSYRNWYNFEVHYAIHTYTKREYPAWSARARVNALRPVAENRPTYQRTNIAPPTGIFTRQHTGHVTGADIAAARRLREFTEGHIERAENAQQTR